MAIYMRDRVVHHALHQAVAPWWNRSFIDTSFACLPGRGSHRAVIRYLGELRRFRYVLALDIRRYFYSIDRPILHSILLRRLPEAPLQSLVEHILASGADLYRSWALCAWLGWEKPGEDGRGLPIGNLTSQWWGNVYLDGLDHFACRTLRVPSYQRYMDDITVFGDDAPALLAARDQIAAWLARERRLELKAADARPRRSDAMSVYLGYRVSRGGIEIGPKARERARTSLREHASHPERAAGAVQSLAAAWMFGAG